MKKVAVTGGLASGKTTVCKIFEEKGAYVVSADAIVHQLLSPQSSVGNELVALLGEESIRDTRFDHERIAKKVFNDTILLKALEAILHPAVLKEIEEQFNNIQGKNHYTIFVVEIPLLYEIDKAHLFDKVIAIIADPKIAKRRFHIKHAYSPQEFERRMAHQLPLKEKSARADFTITNNGSFKELKQQVEAIYQQLTQED